MFESGKEFTWELWGRKGVCEGVQMFCYTN